MTHRNQPLRFIDFETAPQPRELLEPRCPDFAAPAGWKDPEKIAAKIAEQREKWFEDGALEAHTGEILVAILVDEFETVRLVDADEMTERGLLEAVSAWFSEARMGASFRIGGFNVFDFDFPFFIRRCLAKNVKLPQGFVRMDGRWPQWAPWLFDLRALWAVGERHAKGSLGDVAQALGVGQKTSSGADFAARWRDPQTHAEAVAYALNDGMLMPRIAHRMASIGFALNPTPQSPRSYDMPDDE